jgi:hypothetical protein
METFAHCTAASQLKEAILLRKVFEASANRKRGVLYMRPHRFEDLLPPQGGQALALEVAYIVVASARLAEEGADSLQGGRTPQTLAFSDKRVLSFEGVQFTQVPLGIALRQRQLAPCARRRASGIETDGLLWLLMGQFAIVERQPTLGSKWCASLEVNWLKLDVDAGENGG